MARVKKSLKMRLCESMREDRRVLEPYRKQFLEWNRAYAGAHWSERAKDKEMPCNMIDLFVRAMMQNLVAKNPRFQLRTWDRQHEPSVKAAEKWANQQAEEQRFDLTFQRAVFNALGLFGMVKVSLCTPSEASMTGWRARAGTAYMESIDPDDFVGDMHAHTFDTMSYQGHRFRVPLESVMKSDLYDGKGKRLLEASQDQRYNEEGDEKTSHLGRNDYNFTEELEDMVDLWSIYLRRSRRMLTVVAPMGGVPGGEDDNIILRDVEWFGPDDGPYHFLGLGPTPSGNPIPKAPGMDLIFPNEVINNLLRKLIGQGGRQKSLAVGRRGGDEDAKAVMNASDGEMILLNDPTNVTELRFGGPDAANFQLFDYMRTMFDQLAGNLSTMLGLQPLAKTAKQEGMLDANSSRSMASLQETTVSFVARVCRAWLWYEWNSPGRLMKTKFEVEGFPQYDKTRYVFPNTRRFRDNPRTRPMTRTAKFGKDFQVSIDPYSLQFSTPSARANQFKAMMMNVIMPMYALLKQQGKEPDMDYFFETCAQYEDMPEYRRLLQTTEPLPEDGQGGGGTEGAGEGAGPKTREYVRRSEAGEPDALGDNDNVTAMMAVQPSANGSHR